MAFRRRVSGYSEKRNCLINLRKRRRLTQQQVASRVFIDRSFYVQIENGLRNASSDVAKKIADVLELHYGGEGLVIVETNGSKAGRVYC